MSIKNRIYISFFLLVSLFVINGVVTIITLNNNKELSRHIAEVVDPSIQALGDFQDMMINSKMYSTNWVFLRYSADDKNALLRLHNVDYPKLKARLKQLSSQWENNFLIDSLNKVSAGFDQLLFNEKYIMNSLKNFEDYDNPEKKLGAEDQLENTVLPKTLVLIKALNHIISAEQANRTHEQITLEHTAIQLRNLILLLAASIILLGIFLSVYMSRIIITPIDKIRSIINDLGKGIIRNVDHKASRDEIGEMIHSVNNLSEKLEMSATFAHEVGRRNFGAYYQPISEHDTLGKALIVMRDNIKTTNDDLLANNAELKKTNSELDKFVYSVSHDLRAPLSSMLGIVEISEDITTESLMLEHLSFLKGSIKKLDDFIKDILNYSRNSRLEVKKEEINFKEMLEDITNNLKYMSSNNTRQVDIKVEIKNQKLFLSDKSRISVLLNNLISNAIRYQNPSTDNPFVDVQIDMSDTETGIIIKDNGIGISKENQKKIFDMFYRVSENSVGSGLGLYLVKEIIEKLHGQIEVESEPGKGTAFSIHIPNN